MLVYMEQNWTELYEKMSDKLFLATTLAIVSMIIVFIILVLIIFSIRAMSSAIGLAGKNGENKRQSKGKGSSNVVDKPVDMNAGKATDGALSSNNSNKSNTNNLDGLKSSELVAVIAAAIASYEGHPSGSAPYPGFRVKSIRRI